MTLKERLENLRKIFDDNNRLSKDEEDSENEIGWGQDELKIARED